jgi:hypothetical protein
MNSIIDDISERILHKEGSLQEFEIDVLVSTLKGVGMKKPLNIKFVDGNSEINIKDLMAFVEQYKCSPTTCKTKNEFEMKMVAMRI